MKALAGGTNRIAVALCLGVLAIAGCVSPAPSPEDRALAAITSEAVGKDKILVSDKAYELVSTNGDATAAFRGTSRDSELICENIDLKGSHRKTIFCYTREERDRMNQDHSGTWLDMLRFGFRADQ